MCWDGRTAVQADLYMYLPTGEGAWLLSDYWIFIIC